MGESGSGKTITALALMRLLRAPLVLAGGSITLGRRHRADDDERPRAGLDPWPSRGDDLPGPAHGTQPRPADRRPAGRGDQAPLAALEGGCPHPSDRAARAGRAQPAGLPHRRLPARVLGRNATARHDRDGVERRPRGSDRGRADDRARRHDPGPHPRSARRPRLGARDQRAPDHPRPRHRGRVLRPRARHVRGTNRRTLRRLLDLLEPTAPVLGGAARGGVSTRHRHLARDPGDSRLPALPHGLATGVRVQPPLPLPGADLPHRPTRRRDRR